MYKHFSQTSLICLLGKIQRDNMVETNTGIKYCSNFQGEYIHTQKYHITSAKIVLFTLCIYPVYWRADEYSVCLWQIHV